MFADIEETLGRELHEVADGLQIPIMPTLPETTSSTRGSLIASTRRRWQSAVVAAAAAVVVAGTVVVLANNGNDGDALPAPEPTTTQTPAPAPTPTPVEPEATLPRTPPTIPYVFENQLYVDGKLVEGNWCCVDGNLAGWLGWAADGWWWGNGRQVERLTSLVDVPPVISPDGKTVAMLRREGGEVMVTGFETRFGGEGLGGFPVDPGKAALGDDPRVTAVTNDRKVIVQGQGQSWLWLPDAGERVVVDLNQTAPGAVILGATAAGLLVTNEERSTFMLATISDEGALSRVANLPQVDDLMTTPDGQWALFVPYGTFGGELAAIETLSAFRVNGDDAVVTLRPPEGWLFRVHAWAWEDDDHVIAAVTSDPGERMARCSVRLAECVLIDTDA